MKLTRSYRPSILLIRRTVRSLWGPFSLFKAYPTDVSVGDADEYGELVKPTSVVTYRQSTPHSELSLPLFQDSEISLLLYHYQDHVTGLLQPVIHPENPWRTTYIPFALEGRLDLFLAHNSAPSSTASTAIFHGILSSAAFHLRNLTSGSKRFNCLGFQHRTKALAALNTALIDINDSHLYTVKLITMLSLVTINTITGEDFDFPIHLEGCQQLRDYYGSNFIVEPSQPVNIICHFLTLLGRSTSTELQVTQTTDDWRSEKPLSSRRDTHIEYIYGITPTLENILHRTCQISEALELCDRQHIPSSFQNARDVLRAELLTWSLATDDCHLANSGAGPLEIVSQQACAFHSAVLILYHRSIEPHPLINPQKEVLTVWENPTIAEQKKEYDTQKQKYGAFMSWPDFIVVCEAVDRQLWIEWWEAVQRYNLGNFRRQWDIIREIWDMVDIGMCWREELHRSGKLVLLI